MLIDAKELKEFVENNPKLVSRKESKRYPGLFVLKYSRKVFYDNLWDANPLLLKLRGLVVDADYKVIVKPFTKVFNHGENGTTIDPEALCTVVRKVNGFMACATRVPGYDELVISTTGSLDSEHVDIAKRHIDPYWRTHMVDGETWIFEICDKDDPHIISELPGAYLIGGNLQVDGQFFQWSERSLNVLATGHRILRPFSAEGMRFKDVLASMKGCLHEGYMVYSDDIALKIKSPYYLITKFLARMKDEKLKTVLYKGNIRNSMRNFDEEYYPLIQYLDTMGEYFRSADEQERIRVIKTFLGS